MWLASYSRRIVDGDVHSKELQTLFGWHDAVPVSDVATQLRMFGHHFDLLSNSERIDDNNESSEESSSVLRQTMTSEIPRLYNILNNVRSHYEVDVVRSKLHGCAWLWMGTRFVSPDHAAFTSSINAVPYLFTVPPDLAVYRSLLKTFGVRDSFGSSDFCDVLQVMANEQNDDDKDRRDDNARRVAIAINLVQALSDDVLKLKDIGEIYAPSEDGRIVHASVMVYDDAPWLSKNLPGKKDLIFVHPKISVHVAEKIGAQSVRTVLLQDKADTIDFGGGVVHESFSQSESLTRRLRNIIEMYPEGPQQLSELIQNADDARATVVKFVVSHKNHGESSLLGQKLSAWQGPALLCYNDATFTDRDFQNLARIGQASKLEKLATTGRFGLGFNSVFHWTDVPSIVSGDFLVMFDPHGRYVPGNSKGIKIRFTDSSLHEQFPDQMSPYCHFGCDMQTKFQGTLFRFPFRTESTAAESEISKTQCAKDGAIDGLVDSFKKVISKYLLFLRNVKRIEVYTEGPNADDKPQLAYFAAVTKRDVVYEKTANSNSATGWNSITDFIKGPQSHPLTKESFYSKLQRTPVDMLPKTKHVVSIQSVYNTMKPDIQSIKSDNKEAHQETNDPVTITDEYLICMALGGGSCRTFVCEENNRDLKLLPWGGCAALLRRDGSDAPLLNGNAFCGLPLPAQTMLPLHLNGMFELSANRRDIWYGDDMSGQGEIRSKWNRLLLSDVIAPLYMDLLLAARQLLGPGKQYNSLFPVRASNEVWKLVKASLYRVSQDLPVFYSRLNGGIWVTPNSAIVLGEKDDENNENTCSQLMNILLEEKVNVVALSTDIIGSLKEAGCRSTEVSPNMIRQWFKKQVSHPSLQNRSYALFLLKYCSDDLRSGLRFHELNGLPLVPLCNGKLGEFKETDHFDSLSDLFVGTEIERDILRDASERMVDIWTPDSDVNILLTKLDLHAQTNLSALDQEAFVSLLSHAYPQEWAVLSEVRWSPSESAISGPASEKWIISLWEYIAKSQSSVTDSNAEECMQNFVNTWQILPSLVGERERTLSKLSYGMGVVSLINPLSGTESINEKISHILMNIGIRVLDISLFKSESRLSILRRLEGFVQPPTVAGVLLALCNSLPSDILDEDLIRRVGLRCKFLSTKERDLLRGFLRDPRHRDEAFDSESVRMLKALPIFRVYTRGDDKPVQCENLLTERFLPPTDFDPAFLDETFVHTTSQRDVELLELLGVRKIGLAAYFERWVCPRIIEGNVSPEVRDLAINKLLQQDLSSEMANNSNDVSWKEQLSEMQFIPNRNGDLVRARDLYDPTELGTTGILDGSMLPAKPFCHIGALSSLRLLGLKSRLTASGVLESARSIEALARSDTLTHIDNHIQIVQTRALCLLGFLDKDETIQELLDELEEKDDDSRCVSFEEAEETIDGQELSLTSEESKNSWFLEELNAIAWLPVEQQRDSGSTASPPRKRHALSHVGIAAPNATRPKEDEWLCSSSMETLCTNLRSTTLTQCFGWQFPVPVAVIARQLLDLAQLHEENQKEQSFRAKLATVIPRCYEILNQHCESCKDTDSNQVPEFLRGKPWIWVGSAFVSSDQVAFDCPETARPYLFCVPEEIRCFDALLNDCGVKDQFCADDFVSLSMQMKKQVGNHAASQKQIEMMVFVTKYLSEFPEDELNSIQKDRMYLPARDGKMYRAVDMTFDDAPWLSRRVSERTRDRYRFVHDDIGTGVAQILGAKSLRDALSAHQNGMVKVPCPKSDSLARILSSRAVNAAEHYKAILDLLEVGEMHGVKQVSLVLDRRTHDSTSLVHPCLGHAQGPALVICFHDVVLDVEEIVKLTSPSNLYSGSVNGNGGSGGAGFPRYGKGLCGSFLLTDCLQVISGASMLFFDPNGEFFVDGNVKKEKKTTPPTSMDTTENVHMSEAPLSPKQRKTQGSKASARNYSISKDFVTQFPDQLEPFLSLPFGVKESLMNINTTSHGPSFRGTIFRLPLRNIDGPPSNISDHRFEEKDVCAMMSELESKAPLSFLFTYHLQSISVDEILATEAVPIPILRSRVSGSPITRRSHIDELVTNQEWAKGSSKFSKLFKSTWVADKSSYTLQISHRHKNEPADIIDTFVIQSILAPPRFREMACTEALKPLHLIPAITISAHVHSTHGSSTTEFELPKGTLFIGLDTGISTGLPFNINAPLFLHELTGSVLLEKDDDADFRKLFPGIRNVEIKGKNGIETRALALYVWNRQAITSAMKELIPSMLADLRDPLQFMYSRDARLLYRYWPFFSRIRPKFQPLMPKEVYTELAANSNVKLFLTEKGDFCGVKDGYFTSSDHTISGRVADFFHANITIFKVPYRIFDDLNRFDIPSRQLTPSTVRSVLKTQVSHARWLANRPDDALQLLEYCLSDLASVENIAEDASANHICRSEIRGLVLMPLADGSVGTMGRSFIVASAQQQRLLPTITNKFMSISAMQRLDKFLKKPGFMNAIDLVEFTPQVLANHMFSVLPRAWEGKDFVDWFVNHSSGDVTTGIPSPAWLFQFWKEVPIWNHDTVQLFRRWPLIPTTSGQLASCGNARFILCFSPQSQNNILNASLESEHKLTQRRVEDIRKRELLRISAENRSGDKTSNGESISEADTHFRCMGEKDDDDEEETITAPGATDREPELLEENVDEDININGNGSVLQNDEASADVTENANISHTESGEVNNLPIGEEDASSNANGTGSMDTTPSVDTPSSVVPPHEADSSSIQCLHQILAKVRCPIIESAFFCNADILKILPVDRLVLARSILTTLTQSANYWHQIRPEESRLQWSHLSDEEFDSLVLLLCKNQGTRLSLMSSDLTLLRGLPIFQTISGERVSLKERYQHFRLDDTVNLGSLEDCLPESIKSKFLIDKPEFQDLLEDIGVEMVNDAALLQKFILPEFHLMPFTKKEAVCRVILSKWSSLGDSNEFVLVLKDSPFVKRQSAATGGEVLWAKAKDMLDPRHEFFSLMFDDDQSKFPTEEFGSDEWLTILAKLGLKSTVDKDTFIQCALRVEAQESIQKAMELHKYYVANFGEFYDSNQAFSGRLSGIKCVPADFDGSNRSLYKFSDVAVPKDRDMVFKVLPVIPDSIAPPQVMFSSLGIMSPPSVASVLKQVLELTHDIDSLDHWTYKFGSVEKVFGSIFSFLQENYVNLSPRVQNGLRDRPLVPVGTTLVKASQLFFRLTKDLAPFFFEVPRAFGAYDRLLRDLGARDSPSSEDYASSLVELKSELGDGKLNANELQSSIEICNLVANEDATNSRDSMFAPDSSGILVDTDYLVEDDCPWLTQSERLDLRLIHLTHPKLTGELCKRLQIGRLSERVDELFEEGFCPVPVDSGNKSRIENMLKCDSFIETMNKLIDTNSSRSGTMGDTLRSFSIVQVENLRTRFIMKSRHNSTAVDITQNPIGTFAFIEGNSVYVSKTPTGLSSEMVVATALCDYFHLDRKNVACLSAMLASDLSTVSVIGKTMGLVGTIGMDEVLRGTPGHPCNATDIELIELKPLKYYTKGEIVALREEEGSPLIYGNVVDYGGGSSLSRVRVRVGKGAIIDVLSSQIFSFRRGVKATRESTPVHHVDVSSLPLHTTGVLRPFVEDDSDEFESSLVSTNVNPSDSLGQVSRQEIIGAVQDLLRSADLSLDDDVKHMLESNLELREELSSTKTLLLNTTDSGVQLGKDLSKGQEALLCPITREIMTDPVICCDGHTYEREAITQWLRSNSRSPKTNQELASRVLIPNHAMRNTIESMSESMKAVKKFVDMYGHE
uniref:U-box domain-containing protein n=1 Tax=Attheya septentrionalis TaxID=420275 RepID=A0A7S2UD61_9STRA